MVIYLLDKSSIGNVHIMYNASIIKVWTEAYPEADIYFFAEQTHQDLVKSFLGNDANKIKFEAVNILKPKGGFFTKAYQFLQKMRMELKYLKTLFLRANANNAVIFICSIPPILFPTLSKVKKRFAHLTLINTLHGELEYMVYPANFREKQIGRLYSKMFRKNLPNTFYLFLNKIAAPLLVGDKYLKEEACITIDHPYLYKKNNLASKIILNDQPLILGQIGSLGLRKNGKKLYELASECQELIDRGKLMIRTIGAVENDVIPYKNDLVKDDIGKDNKAYIDRDLFEKRIGEIDYALFFYSQEQFIYRASGALFDVLQFEKPLIVLNHPYFRELFSEAGNIGYMVSSLQEMEALIEDIIDRKEYYKTCYEKQIQNILNYQKQVDIENISYNFRIQLENRNIK